MTGRVLVTGAGGYIGSTLVDLLLERGYEVVGFDRYFFGESLLRETLEHPRFTLLRKDIRDAEVADFEGIHGVCDLAALSNDPAGDIDPDLTAAINHQGRSHVAQCAKKAGVQRYILASSCSVYGDGEGRILNERAEPNPLTEYARSNLRAEHAALPLADETFSTTVLRQATVYGLSKRMRFDLIVNVMTLHAVQQGRITVLGGGTQWRPLVHVKDTARAFIIAIEAEREKVSGEIFNVGSNEQNYQAKTVAYIVREGLPFPVEIYMAPSDPDKRNYNVTFDKVRDVLEFTPAYSIGQAVSEVYEALKRSEIDSDAKTYTVGWYRYLLDADKTLRDVILDGRLLR